MPALTPTPTDNGIAKRLGDFANLTDALDYAADGAGGMNFYTARGELADQITWGQLCEDARLLGARLLARGLEVGDRVAIVAETEANFARAMMGCLYAQLVPCPVPLPSAFGSRLAYGEQLRRIADVAHISAALAPPMFGDWISESLADRSLKFIGTVSDMENDGAVGLPNARPAGDDVAYLQFSSGTTSFPKGIAVTHRAMMANLRGMAQDGLKIREDDRGASWLPYYHDMGLVGCVMVPIACQVSTDFLTTRDFILRPGSWIELISRNRGTLSYSPSFGYDLAARRARHSDTLDLSSWRVAGIGGDIIKTANLRSFDRVFAPHGFDAKAFLPSYGMAEASLALSFARLGTGARTESVDVDRLRDEGVATAPANGARSRDFAICGFPLPEHDLEIRGEDGQRLPDGQVGQIYARGPSLMQGYFGNPDETERALSSDGWLDTGDLGYLRDGEIVVTGRVKDLIIVNGRNIWPQDIEWSIESAVDGAKEGSVAAFQLADEGDEAAEEHRIGLVVECRRRELAEREALRQAVQAVVRKTVGIEARVALSAPGALPRTSSGKLSRSKAKDMFLAGAYEMAD